MRLSPLNFSGLIANLGGEPAKSPKKRRVEMVTMYRCPDCYETHEWEEDAEKCCAPTAEELAVDASCPVCGERYEEYREAADCCLWKDIDAPTRWRIADAVGAGSTWARELGVDTELKVYAQ